MSQSAFIDSALLRQVSAVRGARHWLSTVLPLLEEQTTASLLTDASLSRPVENQLHATLRVGNVRGRGVGVEAMQELVRQESDIMQEIAADVSSSSPLLQVISLKTAFTHMSSDAVAQLLSLDVAYTRAINVEKKGSNIVVSFDEIPQHKIRRATLSRDTQCRRCEAEHNLIAHHITPRGAGGSNKPYNLAALCSDCHAAAHGGVANTAEVTYNGKLEFYNQFL